MFDYLKSSGNKINPSDADVLIDLMESIMNFSIKLRLNIFMTPDQLISMFLSAMIYLINDDKLTEKLKNDGLALGKPYSNTKISLTSIDSLLDMTDGDLVPREVFALFGFSKNNSLGNDDNLENIDYIITSLKIIQENQTKIINIFKALFKLDFIKKTPKLNRICKDILNKIKGLLRFLDLAVNTPDKYLSKPGYLF